MLLELHIRNFAIIKDLTLTLSPGFNVLTGETGAGKSIIIDAVKLLLGDRSSPEMVRTGEEEAVVEGLFNISGNEKAIERVRGMGIHAEDGTLLISRRVGKGRGKVYINGTLATLSMLSSIGEGLVAIYGQHEHQHLLRPEIHIDLLDHFGGLLPVRDRIREDYRELLALERELKSLKEKERERIMREDLLRFQIREIEDADLKAGEEEELRKERERLRNLEAILRITGEGYERLYGGEGSVVDAISGVLKGLERISALDDSLQQPLQSLKEALYMVEDVAIQLRDYSGGEDPGVERLEEIEERLSKIEMLKKKYNCSLDELLSLKERLKEELEELKGMEGRIRDLEERIRCLKDRLMEEAQDLSKKRKEAALRFREEVMEELSFLGMEGSLFDPSFRACDLHEKGIDGVEFYISPNKGEALKPLSRIASGGELSRIMLAIKMVSRSEEVPTLIFDEVDAGIGGRIAERVGRRLRALSQDHQVLCVTHLPQVACYGTAHYRVSKTVDGGRTITTVEHLEGEERVEEISRMLGGERLTEKTREHARELLLKANGAG